MSSSAIAFLLSKMTQYCQRLSPLSNVELKKIDQDVVEQPETLYKTSQPISQVSLPNAFTPTLTSDLRKREPAEELMRRKGRWVRDAMYDTKYPDADYIRFLCANRYMKTQALLSSDSDLEFSQTHPIVRFWSILQQAKYAGNMTALLPDPDNEDEMHIFVGKMTLKINPTSKTSDGNTIIKAASKKIIDQWQSLKAAGFTIITAVLPNPENKHNAWFFQGKEFVSVCWEPGPVNDILLDGPHLITEGWASLKAAEFEAVCAFVPSAKFPDQAWVFSWEKYALISISEDTVLFGPAVLPEDWISSRQANFFT